MSQRDYNHVYYLGRFILQIGQDSQHDGICIQLLPQLTLAIANRCLLVGIGAEWMHLLLKLLTLQTLYIAGSVASISGFALSCYILWRERIIEDEVHALKSEEEEWHKP